MCIITCGGGYTNHFDKTLLQTGFAGYNLKYAELRKYNKPEYELYISIELMHYIRSYVVQEIQYKRASRSQITDDLEHIFESQEVRSSLASIRFNGWNSEYGHLCLNREFDKIYDLCHKIANKNKIKNCFIRVLAALLA